MQVNDDGQQTVAETIANNTSNGCATGLLVGNVAHEIGTFTPNTWGGATTPYSPASLGGTLPITNGLVTNLHTPRSPSDAP